ncbi:MAG: cytochrome P450 [Acidimicrobiales bacterium]|jgi:cytochrome P450|nr:cytochrome P450 [Acidimicrobiales bacterium]MDP6900714.1 cytochrome P450 [Acidimicrobiales bacterium]
MSVSDDSPNDPSLSSSESDLDDFNLFDPEIQQCPHMYYAKMQKERGVFETDALGTPLYLVTKYEDVAACAMNTSAFSSRFDAGSMEGNSEYARRAQELYEQEGGFDRVGTMLTVDPPEHTRYRRLVSQAFTPKAIAALEPTIRELAGQLIDELISGTAIGQSLDFVELFAVPLPVAVIAKALNVPDDRLGDFKRWSDASVAGIGTNISIDERLAADREVIEFQKYFADQLELRRKTPQDDILTDLVNAQIDNDDPEGFDSAPLDIAEMLSMIQQLLVAGNQTTTHLLGEMLLLLDEHPEEWARLAEDPLYGKDVADEALRLAAPTQGMFRVVSEDTQVGSTSLSAGSRVVLMYAAANRDPEMWEHPDTFQPGREGQAKHLSFGKGPHYCVGAGLARLEARIVAETLGERLSSIQVTNRSELRYIPSFVLRGPQRIDVVVSAKEVTGNG